MELGPEVVSLLQRCPKNEELFGVCHFATLLRNHRRFANIQKPNHICFSKRFELTDTSRFLSSPYDDSLSPVNAGAGGAAFQCEASITAVCGNRVDCLRENGHLSVGWISQSRAERFYKD